MGMYWNNTTNSLRNNNKPQEQIQNTTIQNNPEPENLTNSYNTTNNNENNNNYTNTTNNKENTAVKGLNPVVNNQDNKSIVSNPLDQQVEKAIESNPVVAEDVIESVSGENSPIENEAEQLNDSNPNNDEVKDEAIKQTPTEEKQEIIDKLNNTVSIGNQISSSEDTPEKQEALKEFQEAPKEVAAINNALSTSNPEEAREILKDAFPELGDGTIEVNLTSKEKAELAAAQALYDNINRAIDEMVSYGKRPRRAKGQAKAEREQARQELDNLETRDQIAMNPDNFLPEPYKQLATVEDKSIVPVTEDKSPMVVAYEIKDDPEDWRRFIDWKDHVFNIPFLKWKGKFYEPKTFGYNKPQINASEIQATDNSIELNDNGHTVAGGSTSNPSFSGGNSGGSVSSSGGVVNSSGTPAIKSATPGKSFGGGHISLVGSGSNPIAAATSSSNGGELTSGEVHRSSDPNISKGGNLSESRTKLPGGWVNNQGPSGKLNTTKASKDHQDKGIVEGSLGKLELLLQEDSSTWNGNNSGDKYAPYIFFIGEDGQFYIQKGEEQQAIKNIDDKVANSLITILTSNK